MNRCPVCTWKISENRLLCLMHWRMVPKPLQDQVNNTWDAMRRGGNQSIRNMALREYRKARDAAIAAVKQKMTA